MQIWILTREINAYDQDGEYFVSAFSQKPTADQIEKICGYNELGAKHVLNGGGRRGTEDEWYNLKTVEAI